jgi:hypothetical protein
MAASVIAPIADVYPQKRALLKSANVGEGRKNMNDETSRSWREGSGKRVFIRQSRREFWAGTTSTKPLLKHRALQHRCLDARTKLLRQQYALIDA